MKVIVIDDDSIVLMSLKMILEAAGITVAGTGSDGADMTSLYELHRPDVILSDIRMKGMDGISAAKELLESHPEAKILFLTTFSDDEYVVDALRYGARGYILKQDYEGIVSAVNAVEIGQSVFGREIVSKIPDISDKSHRKDVFISMGITEKEYEITGLVAEGLSNREIAEKLFLSEGTVRNYLSNILDKLGLRDRTQLAVKWYKCE